MSKGTIDITLISDAVRTVSTGMTEVTSTLTNVAVDDLLNQIDITDIIEHYGIDDLQEAIENSLHYEED